MAMLLEPEVFKRTWGIDIQPFWPRAVQTIKKKYPEFIFLAEVYWDMEWQMQQAGFDFTYDKRLYDRLLQFNTDGVKKHFWAEYEFQKKSVRFLENHDESRIASTLSPEKHKAAAVVTFLCPGLRFLHMGQLEGYENKLSVHLGIGFKEKASDDIDQFYALLLKLMNQPLFSYGKWQLMEALPVWDNNYSNQNFIAFFWKKGIDRALVLVNFSNDISQCTIRLPLDDVHSDLVRIHDLLNGYSVERNKEDLVREGFFLARKPWEFNVFQIDEI